MCVRVSKNDNINQMITLNVTTLSSTHNTKILNVTKMFACSMLETTSVPGTLTFASNTDVDATSNEELSFCELCAILWFDQL